MWAAICGWFSELDSSGIGNLISSAAAIVAIATLIIQSHSTRKQLKLQNYIEYTKRYQEIILNFPENINQQNFDINNILSEETKAKTMRYMRAYLDLCFEEYTLHKKGFIDDDLWSIWEGGMRTAFSKPAFQQAWEIIKLDTEYGPEFYGFANKLELGR